MLMYLRKKVLPVLTVCVFAVALSGGVLFLTGCQDEPDPVMAPTIPREDPPEAPDEDEGEDLEDQNDSLPE